MKNKIVMDSSGNVMSFADVDFASVPLKILAGGYKGRSAEKSASGKTCPGRGKVRQIRGKGLAFYDRTFCIA